MSLENTLITLHKEQAFLQDLVTQILAEAKMYGADAAEVGASISVGLSASVRKGEVDKVEFTQDQGFSITVFCRDKEVAGFSKGSASTADTSPAALRLR